jgi:sulfur-carrier protein
VSATVNLVSYLQSFAGGAEKVTVEGATIRECLNDLVQQYPRLREKLFDENGGLLDFVSIFVNEEIAYIDKLDRHINNGEKLHILYIIGGG